MLLLQSADAEYRKRQKYAHLENTHFFVPVGVETLGVFGGEALSLFKDIGWCILTVTQDPRSHEYLVQRIAVAAQRGNAAAVLGSISSGDNNNNIYLLIFVYYFYLFICSVAHSLLYFISVVIVHLLCNCCSFFIT